jgi:Cys-tRNA(Pro) deacylase
VPAWPEPVQRVASFLRESGAEARLEEFSEGTPTAADAARVVGCEPAQIVKSLVFDCDGRRVLVLVPGDRRADPAKVARAAGADSARVAARDEVERATGYAPGAVAPFALADVHDVLVDRGVLRHELVWVGAGSPAHLAGVAPAELVRLARARPTDAVEGGA